MDTEREWTAADQAWADAQSAEHEEWSRLRAADAKAAAAWVRKMRRKYRRCTQCVDGIDADADGDRLIAWTCRACDGLGWLPKAEALRAPQEPTPQEPAR